MFKRLPWSSLRVRLLLPALFAVVPPVILTCYGAWIDRRDKVASAEQNASALAQVIAGHHIEILDETGQLLATLAQAPDLQDPQKGERLLGIVLRHYHRYAALVVAGPDGQLRSSAPHADSPIDFSDRAWFRSAVASRAFTVGDYQVGRVSGKPILPVSLPVLDANGRVQAVLAASLDLEWATRQASAVTLPPGFTCLWVDGVDGVLARYPGPRQPPGSSHVEPPPLPMSGLPENGVVHLRSSDGQPWIYAVSDVQHQQGPGLRFAVAVPEATALGAANVIHARNVIALSVTGLLALALGWIGADLFVLRRMRSLLRAIRGVEAGDLEARSRLPYGGGELGELAQAFDNMAGALQRRQADEAAAQLALRESEERFRRTFDQSPVGAAIVNLDYHYVRVNEALCALTGYSSEELTSLRFIDITHQDDVDVELREAERLRAGETESFQRDKRYIRKDGSVVWIRLSVRLLRDASGCPLHFLPMMENITDRWRAEERLRHQLELEELISGISTDFVNVLSADVDGQIERALGKIGRFLSVDRGVLFQLTRERDAVHRTHGWNCDGQAFPDAPGATFRPEVFPWCTEKLQRLEPFYFTRLADMPAEAESARDLFERFKMVSVAVMPLAWEGMTAGFLAFNTAGREKAWEAADIALLQVAGEVFVNALMRRQADESLRENEAKYRGLFELESDSLFLIDNETGRILDVNAAACTLYGFGRDAFLGMRNIDVSAEPEDTRLATVTGRTKVPTRYHRKRDGTVFPVEITATHLTFGGRPVHLAAVRDSTARFQAEAELREREAQFRHAQKMEAIGRLAGGMAHDFNNLLTVILGYGDLLLQQLDEDDPRKADIREIWKAGESGAALTRQLLAFSRKQVLEPRHVNLNRVVDNLDKLLRRVIGEDVVLAMDLAPDLALVRVDAGQMDQVLMNLAVNARDAMPQGGVLALETANVNVGGSSGAAPAPMPPGEYVRLAIRDTGCGMDSEVQSHLFEPFFTTKPHGQGTGLGLSTVYGIVKQSGGHIWVDSEPGHGTTFTIYLPRIAGAPDAVTQAARPASESNGREVILLVEDDAHLRELAARVLRGQGYVVLSARGAEEGLNLCSRSPEPIHLLLTDVVMPGKNGFQLARQAVSLRPAMRVLFMSGYADRDNGHGEDFALGTAFLSKPYTSAALTQKVQEILRAGEGLEAKEGGWPSVTRWD